MLLPRRTPHICDASSVICHRLSSGQDLRRGYAPNRYNSEAGNALEKLKTTGSRSPGARFKVPKTPSGRPESPPGTSGVRRPHEGIPRYKVDRVINSAHSAHTETSNGKVETRQTDAPSNFDQFWTLMQQCNPWHKTLGKTHHFSLIAQEFDAFG